MEKHPEEKKLAGIELIGSKEAAQSEAYAQEIAEKVNGEKMFPVRELVKLNKDSSLLSAKNYYNYHYQWNNILDKTDAFTVIKCKHSASQGTRIAKIYDKTVIDANPLIYDDIKKEIVLMHNLRSSEFVLRLEAAFETKLNIYLVYEGGESLPNNFVESLSSSEDLKYFIFCAICGLCEVNSFGQSVVSFDISNIVRV